MSRWGEPKKNVSFPERHSLTACRIVDILLNIPLESISNQQKHPLTAK